MKYTEKSKQSPRIPITVKHILKASETMIYNVNAMTLLYGNTKLQYQLIWKPIAEQNSRNEMFVQKNSWYIWKYCQWFQRPKICANLPRSINNESMYILQRFRKYWWQVLRFEKEIVKKSFCNSQRTEQEDFSLKWWTIIRKKISLSHHCKNTFLRIWISRLKIPSKRLRHL